MLNINLPDDNGWDKIISDAFSSNDIHSFSEGYKQKKREMKRSVIMKKNTGNKRTIRMLIAAAAIAAAVPVSVFAYTKISAEITKTNTYENTVSIGKMNETEEINGFMKPEFTYIPSDMHYNEDGAYAGKYKNAKNGGMTPVFYKVPDGGISEKLLFSEHYEQYDFDDRTVMISYRISFDEEKASPDNFGREVWIAFSGTNYAECIYVTDDISFEEVMNISKGIKLVPSDTEIAGVWTAPEVFYDNGETLYSCGINVDVSKANIHLIGEKIPYYDNAELTIDNVTIQDTFEGIDTDVIGRPADFSEYADADGKIKTVERTWIVSGNGSDTLDNVIKTEQINKKVAVIDLTIYNNSDTESDFCICPKIYRVYEGKFYRSGCVPFENANGVTDSGFFTDYGSFCSFKTDKSGGKNHVLLAPGESAKVQLAFLIDDTEEPLYFSADEIYNYYRGKEIDLVDLSDCIR